MISEYVTDSKEALDASAVDGVSVWIHGSKTFVTTPDVVDVVSDDSFSYKTVPVKLFKRKSLE